MKNLQISLYYNMQIKKKRKSHQNLHFWAIEKKPLEKYLQKKRKSDGTHMKLAVGVFSLPTCLFVCCSVSLSTIMIMIMIIINYTLMISKGHTLLIIIIILLL